MNCVGALLLVTVATLAMAGCNSHEPQNGSVAISSGASAQTPEVRSTGKTAEAAKPSTPSIVCPAQAKDAEAAGGVCAAYAKLDSSDTQLEAIAARVVLSHAGGVKPLKPPEQQYGADIAQIDKIIADATNDLPESARTGADFIRVQNAYKDCANKIIHAPDAHDISDDVTDQIADSCRFQVRRLVATYFRGIGVNVPAHKDTDVFGLHWGETVADVERAKGQPTSNEDGVLGYKVSVAGLDTMAILGFVDDHLSNVTYIFTPSHTDANLYISDFDSVDSALKAKYGQPQTHGVYWRDNLYQNDRAHWGVAIAAGQMYMTSSWENDDTKIDHRLIGDNFHITHGIRYLSREYRLASDAAKAAAENKNL